MDYDSYRSKGKTYPDEEGLGSSYMARKAAKQLMQRTGADPDDIDLVIVATSTPDYHSLLQLLFYVIS